MSSTHATLPAPLVSAQWLSEKIGTPGIVIIDGSWYLPALKRDPHQEYLEGHIPGAVFFDLDAISSHATDLPHMMPEPTEFASAMRKLGISDGATIIVYDGLGLFSAPRIWWMLKAFGARDVHVLDGGLPAWKAANLPLEDGDVIRAPSHFTARLDHSVLASLGDVQRALAAHVQVLDARPAERFRGEVAEPRPGLRMGHIPGSKSLPFSALLDNGRMKSPDQLNAVFAQAGIDGSKPVITSCGSGVSAAIITLALTVAGHKAGALYDGSWAEWGKADGPAIETGP